ncbi:MAG: type II toxin-antitoxin system VapC family toxin [Moorea sp. SIO3C2]|nr:type II toxin-antitoxin system VapC family toxin [Moorena sp. SIO3C2]
MKYLLDTNICIYIIKRPGYANGPRYAKVADQLCCAKGDRTNKLHRECQYQLK